MGSNINHNDIKRLPGDLEIRWDAGPVVDPAGLADRQARNAG